MDLTGAELGIVATALVGITGPLVVALSRRGDRAHDVQLRLIEREAAVSEEYRRARAAAYVDALTLAERVHREVQADTNPHRAVAIDPVRADDADALATSARVAAYGSETVRGLLALLVVQAEKHMWIRRAEVTIAAKLTGAAGELTDDERRRLTAEHAEALTAGPDARSALEESIRDLRAQISAELAPPAPTASPRKRRF